jgi:hypothetical protein
MDLNSTVPGKQAGKVTPVGYLGIGLGVFLLLAGVAAMVNSPVDVGEKMFIAGLGVGIVLMCYLWVRR